MAKAKKGASPLDRAMRDSLNAYAAGDLRFFDFLRDDVRVYTVDSSEPIVGRKAFESYFGPTFTKTKRTVSVVHSDLVMSGERAVLSQTLQVTAQGVTANYRQTVIWEQASDGRWQMTHIHNATVGQPILVAQKAPSTAAAVRVLNERIATVAAVFGVAQ